jgi:lipopolysaccharide biosynthesis regulator YciM
LDNILPAYDDPLFSILIIIILILIVAVSSLVVGSYKEKNKKTSLKKFLGGFKKSNCVLAIEEMPFEKALIRPLTLLAEAFKNQGEYPKAINLNLYLIDNIPNFFEKEKILEQLGSTYLKAGFLKRSKLIFLEILKKHPRNKKALYHLGIVYELLHEFDKALETLQPLQILGEKTKNLEAHIELSKLLENKKTSKEEKVNALVELLKEKHYPYRRIMKVLFSLNLKKAWDNIDNEQINSILDILWFLPSLNLNFNIISKNETLSAIYLAKGHIEANNSTFKSNIFSVDTIISAKKSANNEVDLLFSYGCGKCKNHFPIGFTRCPKCYAIDAIQIKETLVKKQAQTGYSLL